MAVIRARRNKEDVHKDRLSNLQRAYESLTLMCVLASAPVACYPCPSP